VFRGHPSLRQVAGSGDDQGLDGQVGVGFRSAAGPGVGTDEGSVVGDGAELGEVGRDLLSGRRQRLWLIGAGSAGSVSRSTGSGSVGASGSDENS
jgi:hypothetical protein